MWNNKRQVVATINGQERPTNTYSQISIWYSVFYWFYNYLEGDNTATVSAHYQQEVLLWLVSIEVYILRMDFVLVLPQTLVLNKYNNTPTFKLVYNYRINVDSSLILLYLMPWVQQMQMHQAQLF